ncbi:colicin-like bacteriocin tRNase domain-containing protein [Yersinia kristensenii]|uniref:colicin-like bacteriocin tRNase domain-containing protein n=1 Tax=Yersinia kristensenii TaxID=28152 RepID=UPI0011A10B65|nr:colicin-like bacteriocin tRNase domain-containing protein [Yersinia kristensenii]
MGEGHSNVSGHGSRGPTGGVKGGPTGFGGGNPNSGKGWGVSQTPYGPLHNYNPSKFGHGNRRGGNRGGHAGHRGNTPNLSQRPELQVAIVPGVAVPLSLVASEWGLTLFKPKIVAGALDLALTRLAMFAVDAAPYVGRFAGVVGMLLAPSEIAKDDMSVIRRTVVTLPAERITSVPFAQLPTQPAVVADARLHDVVQDGVQKIAVVKSKHVPIMVPVVQAKPTARPGIFTAQILNGMPPIHIHVEKSSQPPATVQATGVSEVRDSPVTPVFSPLGNNSHDAIVYFPAEADTDPVYISVTTVLTPEQIKQGEEEDRQKQAQWEASYPVEAAQYQLSQAKDALVREQHNVEPYQAALEKLKNTWEGQLLSDPDEYPFSYEFDDYVYMWGNYGYHFMFDIEIKNREDLDNLLNIGGEAFDPFPDGLSQEDLEKYGDYAGYIMQELKIEQYDLLREHLLVHQDEINAAQLVLNSFQYQLDIAIDAVNNAEQHLTQVRAQLAEAENARLAAEAVERQRINDEKLAAIWLRMEKARLAAKAADDLARQQGAFGQDTYSLPAHPLISRYSPSFAVAGVGAVILTPQVIHGLTGVLGAALAKLRTYATSWWNSPLAMMVGASFNPLGTGHDLGAVPLAGSIALSEMGLSPTTPLPPQGEIVLPVRMLMINTHNGTKFYAVKTGAAGISTKVKAGAAQFDRSKGVYTFTTDSQPPRTFTFTPVRPSGVDIGWIFPQPASAPATPLHTGVTIKYAATPVILPFPQLAERDFHDYIIWFPAESGLQPVYVYLNSPRGKSGEVTGRGQRVVGIWLAEAGKGLGVPIPTQIADKLRGRTFSSFDRFREAFWQEVAKDPELAGQFNKTNYVEMLNQRAPYPPSIEQIGDRKKYEIHHVKFINNGGEVYNIENLRIITPKRHINIHSGNRGK